MGVVLKKHIKGLSSITLRIQTPTLPKIRVGLMVATSHPQVIGLVPGNPEILRHIWILRADWATNGFTCPCPSIYIWTISQTRRSTATRWPNQTTTKICGGPFSRWCFFFCYGTPPSCCQAICFGTGEHLDVPKVKSLRVTLQKNVFFCCEPWSQKNGNIIIFVFFETPGFFKVRFGLVMFFEIWTHFC